MSLYPGAQIQVIESTPSTQVPPFRQELVLQSSISKQNSIGQYFCILGQYYTFNQTY